MNNQTLVYLTIQLYQHFDLQNQHIIIDELYNNIKFIYYDYIQQKNNNLSLLDSINNYILKNKIGIAYLLKIKNVEE